MSFTASVSSPFLRVWWVQMGSLLHTHDPLSFPFHVALSFSFSLIYLVEKSPFLKLLFVKQMTLDHLHCMTCSVLMKIVINRNT